MIASANAWPNPPAKGWIGDDSDFAHVPRPSVALTLKDGGADYPFVCNGHDHGLAVDIDLIKPDFDLVTIEKVFLQKGAVFLGNVLEEVPYFGAILRYKRSQGHRRSIPKSNDLWIGGEQIACN
jgi:hypothetical protein